MYSATAYMYVYVYMYGGTMWRSSITIVKKLTLVSKCLMTE